MLRAAIGYALAEDKLGLGRFRDKYAAKMAAGPDGRAFDVVTAPLGTSGAEFREIARVVASVDTLDGFLRDLQARYPDAGAAPPSSRATGAAGRAASRRRPHLSFRRYRPSFRRHAPQGGLRCGDVYRCWLLSNSTMRQ